MSRIRDIDRTLESAPSARSERTAPAHARDVPLTGPAPHAPEGAAAPPLHSAFAFAGLAG
jgi:hypothetical protein